VGRAGAASLVVSIAVSLFSHLSNRPGDGAQG
jgi:hypothetical protein